MTPGEWFRSRDRVASPSGRGILSLHNSSPNGGPTFSTRKSYGWRARGINPSNGWKATATTAIIHSFIKRSAINKQANRPVDWQIIDLYYGKPVPQVPPSKESTAPPIRDVLLLTKHSGSKLIWDMGLFYLNGIHTTISDHHIYYHLIENIPNWMDLSKNEWKIIIDQRPEKFLKVQIL